MRWMPDPGELPSYPGGPSPSPSPVPAAAPAATPSAVVPNMVAPNGLAPRTGAGSIHQIGEVIGGRYRLDRMIGHGALTETWAASHVDLQREVAIKFLRQQAIGVGEKMIEVARAVARVHHPHVLEFSDFGRMSSGDPYFVAELLVGQTVEKLIARRGTVPWSRAVNIAQQVCAALTAAHQQGIVHGDLRPGNVFLVDTGEVGDFVKVVDFGLARGTTIGGTPAYMSPEQCRNEAVDGRSDVYAMGCLLFAMVTGDPPFVGDPDGMRFRQMSEAPKSLRERAPRQFIPDELEIIVKRCLEKQPAQRYPDTRELGAALATLANFAAATSVAGGVIQDPNSTSNGGSGSRPMTFAGRPPVKDPKVQTGSHAPVNQAIANDVAKPTGLSAGAVVGIVFASLIVAAAAGVGVWWLVTKLISEQPAAAQTQPSEQAQPSQAAATPSTASADAAPSETAADPAAAPTPPPAESPTPEAPDQAAPDQAPDQAPPSDADAGTSTPSATTDKPKSSSKRGIDATDGAGDGSEPAPQPEPAPAPAPEPDKKPSMKPDSKANQQIGHEELVDPWN